MAEFVVNVVLIVAVLVLLIAWAVSASRRRRSDRREHAAERRLILGAFTGAGAAPTVPVEPRDDDAVTHAARSARCDTRPNSAAAPAAPQRLDAACVAALFDLLEDRRPARRGVIASLVTSPRSVWSAGIRAGQTIGRRTIGEPVKE